jgi:tRNA1(Val) A37 N6-methylase TrmN6
MNKLGNKTKEKAKKYLEEFKNRSVPYKREVMGVKFVIENTDVYPPGKLANMFCRYLIAENVFKDKTVLDMGCGVFTLGIIGLKHGAKQAIGVDINPRAVESAISNLNMQREKEMGMVIEGYIKSLLPEYQNKIDVIVSGIPWDSIETKEFNNLDEDKKLLARAFYDLDDGLIEDVFGRSKELLRNKGKIYITSCDQAMERIERIAKKYNLRSSKVNAEDLHKDGNIHYILKIERK